MKRIPKADRHGALPSREALLAYLGGPEAPDKATKRDVAKAFGVKGEAKRALKDMIVALREQGAIQGSRKALTPAGRLPRLLAARLLERARDGSLIAITEDLDGAPPKRILVLEGAKKRGRAPAPRLGARVLLRTDPNTHPERGAPDTIGRIVKLLERANPRLLAVYRTLPSGAGRATPVDKRERMREIDVPRGMSGEAEDGDLVRIEILRHGRSVNAAARVFERMGSVNSPKTISLIAIAAHGVPDEFPEGVLAESEAAKPAILAGREDWRDLALLTIDPADARDHDDAVHARADDDPANPGGHVLTVAIADVAAFVLPGSAMDEEAEKRGNSVYLPDRVVPMLPERISNDLCSLRAGEDRAALAARIIIDARGHKRSHSFHRIMMRSAAKLTYQQAQRAFDGQPDATTRPLLAKALKPLLAAYEALKLERAQREPLDLDLKERKLILDEEGRLARVDWPERLDAHRLIEEFMILANVAAAQALEERETALLYRIHDAPSDAKIDSVREFLKSLDLGLTRGETLKPKHFNRALDQAKGRADSALINETVLRSQSQAEYSPVNVGHFGLNLRRYAHFTSPIRRYADLIVHRALIRAYKLGPGGLPDLTERQMEEIGQDISRAERRAMMAERETADRIIAHYMSAHIGATFEARVSGIVGAGLFVRLKENGADGFVPASSYGGVRAKFGARKPEKAAATFRLGDEVRVRLLEAAPIAGALRFEIVGEAKGKALGARRPGPARRGN